MLLRIVGHPDFDPMSLRFKSIEAYHRRVDMIQQDGMLYSNMHEVIDGDQVLEIFPRHNVDVMHKTVKYRTSSEHYIWTFTKTSEKGSNERTFGDCD